MSNGKFLRYALSALSLAGVAGCMGGGGIEERSSDLASVSCLSSAPVPAGYFRGPCGPASGNLHVSLCTCYPTAPVNPTVALDWSMPDQTGIDTDGDGIVNLSPPGNPPAAGSYLPSSWTVTLNACGSTPAPAYAFDVTMPTGVQHIEAGSSCRATATVPTQGTYPTTVTAKYSNAWVTASRPVVVKNYLIVSLGDSIASGEGNPDVPSSGGWRAGSGAKWENQSCHRSAKSGPALAALAIEQADYHSSVTFLSQACSGAAIETPMSIPGGGGVLTPYGGEESLPNGQKWMPQLAAVARVTCPASAGITSADGPNWVNTLKDQCRPIDALIMTAGANDAGFGVAAEACSIPDFDCSTNHDLTQDVYNALQLLPGELNTLGASLKSGLNVKSVFFPEYPDPTHDQYGALCGTITLPGAISDIVDGHTGFFTGLAANLVLSYENFSDGQIVPSEVKWLHDGVVAPLNATVASAASANGWNLVTGIAADFQTHGYCSTTPWIVHYETSVAQQGNADGTFHPNAAGHQDYASHIASTILAKIPGGAALGGVSSTKFGAYSTAWPAGFYGSHGTFLGDLDKDGKKDLVGVGDGYIGVIRSTGKSTFGAYETWFTGNFFGSHGTLVGDVDGDGRADVIALNDGSVTVKRSNGNGFNGAETWATIPFYGSHGTFAADVDGDGKDDLVGIGDGYIGVLRSNGSNGYRPYETWLSGNFFGSHGTYVADIDGDGMADLVGLGDGYVGVMHSTGHSFASYGTALPYSFYGTHGSLVADVTGDGLADIVALNDGEISVAASQGQTFANPTVWWAAPFYGSHGTVLGDVTGDGRADLVGMGDNYVGETNSSP